MGDQASMQPPVLPTDPLPTQDEKHLGLIMHASGFIFLPVVIPLVVWLIKRNQSAFIDIQGRELLNFSLSFLIYVLGCFILIPFIGWNSLLILTVVFILQIVLGIIGLVKAAKGKIYRFPLTIRML
jgi:uncharacterized Tic20 family protein